MGASQQVKFVGGSLDVYALTKFEKHQHKTHKKSHPWVMLHKELLDDYKFNSMSPWAQLLWFKMLLLASRSGNKMVLQRSTKWQFVNLIPNRRLPLALHELEENQLVEKISFERDSNADTYRLEENKEKERKHGVDSITPSIKTIPKNRRLTPQEIEYQKRESFRKFGSAQGAPNGPTAAEKNCDEGGKEIQF